MILTWNNADRTWNCPCHGSIFAGDGTMSHGPERDPLHTAKAYCLRLRHDFVDGRLGFELSCPTYAIGTDAGEAG